MAFAFFFVLGQCGRPEEEGSALVLGSLVEINVGEVLIMENAHTCYTHIYEVVRFIEFCLCDNYLVPWFIFLDHSN